MNVYVHIAYADPDEIRGQGVRKITKNIGFLSITGLDPLKITKLPRQHSMLGHHWPPAKRHLNGVSLVGREWPAFSAILDSLFPHKITCQSLTPLAKLSGPAHVLYFAIAPSH